MDRMYELIHDQLISFKAWFRMLLFCLHAATFEWSRLAPCRGRPMKNSKEYLKMTTKIRAEACSKVHFSGVFEDFLGG